MKLSNFHFKIFQTLFNLVKQVLPFAGVQKRYDKNRGGLITLTRANLVESSIIITIEDLYTVFENGS